LSPDKEEGDKLLDNNEGIGDASAPKCFPVAAFLSLVNTIGRNTCCCWGFAERISMIFPSEAYKY
jgi:hypothetical protein